MRILFDHPKSVAWRLSRLSFPDGRVRILVGNQRALADEEREHAEALAAGAVLERVQNCIVEMAMRFERASEFHTCFDFLERDGQRLRFSIAQMAEIYTALEDGRLRLVDGWTVGTWSFAKRGTGIVPSIWDGGPDRPTAFADAGDAPDLSALVAALPTPA